MIDIIAQSTVPGANPNGVLTGVGPFGPLVLAVTCAMGALSLILVQVLRGWKKWRPVGEFFPDSAVRIASLCAAAAMVLAFTHLQAPETTRTLTWTLVIGAVGALASLMVYNVLFARWIFVQMIGQDAQGKVVTKEVVGGLLTTNSRAKLAADSNLTEQKLFDATNGDPDLLWRRGSRGIIASCFLVAFTVLVTFAALAATAIGLFTLLAAGLLPANMNVRVPATVLLSESITPQAVTLGNGGFIVVPAGHRAVFVSGTATDWTSDRLELIEKRLSSPEPFRVDVSRMLAAFSAAEGDREKFVAWLESEFERLVDDGWTAKVAASPYPLFEQSIRAYAADRLFTIISECARNSQNEYAIDLNNEQSLIPRDYRRAVWKRVVLVALRDSGSLDSQLGPYFSITAEDLASRGPGGPGSPSPNALHGSLVGGFLTPDPDTNTLSVKLGSASPFSKAGDALVNGTASDAPARLGMNDRIPYDNGPGYADVVYRLEKLD